MDRLNRLEVRVLFNPIDKVPEFLVVDMRFIPYSEWALDSYIGLGYTLIEPKEMGEIEFVNSEELS